MIDNEESAASGPISSLLGSVSKVLATLVGIVQTRLEILSTELQEEVRQAAQLLLWGFVALLAAGMGLLLTGLVIIFAFWDTHRILVAVLVTAFWFLVALLALLRIRVTLQARGRLFEATLAEFSKDREQLKARL